MTFANQFSVENSSLSMPVKLSNQSYENVQLIIEIWLVSIDSERLLHANSSNLNNMKNWNLNCWSTALIAIYVWMFEKQP